jgi:hypothetical protein
MDIVADISLFSIGIASNALSSSFAAAEMEVPYSGELCTNIRGVWE